MENFDDNFEEMAQHQQKMRTYTYFLEEKMERKTKTYCSKA